MMGRYEDDAFFQLPPDRAEVKKRMFEKAGIKMDGDRAPEKPEHKSDGSIIFRKNPYLRGSTLTSIGGSNGRQDIGGTHDLTLWKTIEHPRLEVMTKIYPNRVERTFLVDGEPFADLDKAAALLAEREAVTGIYDRPKFDAGTPEDRDD